MCPVSLREGASKREHGGGRGREELEASWVWLSSGFFAGHQGLITTHELSPPLRPWRYCTSLSPWSQECLFLLCNKIILLHLFYTDILAEEVLDFQSHCRRLGLVTFQVVGIPPASDFSEDYSKQSVHCVDGVYLVRKKGPVLSPRLEGTISSMQASLTWRAGSLCPRVRHIIFKIWGSPWSSGWRARSTWNVACKIMIFLSF